MLRTFLQGLINAKTTWLCNRCVMGWIHNPHSINFLQIFLQLNSLVICSVIQQQHRLPVTLRSLRFPHFPTFAQIISVSIYERSCTIHRIPDQAIESRVLWIFPPFLPLNVQNSCNLGPSMATVTGTEIAIEEDPLL